MAKFKDYYAVLGIPPRSHARVIEERYWEMAHGLHNDLHVAPTKKMQKRLHQINEAYERMLKSDVRYRFVIDIDSLRHAAG